MRKFIIKHTKYGGEIEVVYNAHIVQNINFSNAQITPDVLAAFKRLLPATLAEFTRAKWIGNDGVIVEADYEITFDQFWNDYGKKINKSRSILLWQKMNKAMQLAAWTGIKKYDAYLKKESWRGKADPETYLRNRYWENEY